jgi:hypothetical protein
MSAEFWAIIAVGGALVYANVVAADENEKRLDRIAALLREIRNAKLPGGDL